MGTDKTLGQPRLAVDMVCNLHLPSARQSEEYRVRRAVGLLVENSWGLQDLNMSTKNGWDQSLNGDVRRGRETM